MLNKILPNLWKFTGSDKSNSYYLDVGEKIIIDAGNRSDRQTYIQFFGKAVNFDSVHKVIFTHLHYDHIGNFDLFKNAKFFASAEEIADLERNSEKTILDKSMAEKFKVKLYPLPPEIAGLEVIKTPGHTKGSICLWYKEGKVLFTGDTLFGKKMLGRTDLATSAPQQMNASVLKLVDYNHKILAPGHDY